MWALGSAAAGALLTAFCITLLELTEVVALLYVLGTSSRSMRPCIYGALAGIALVVGFGTLVGSELTRVPVDAAEAVGAGALWALGAYLGRSTLRAYRRAARTAAGSPSDAPAHRSLSEEMPPSALFSAGFSVGAVESLEAVIVLLGLAAGGSAPEAVAGALVASGVLLVGVALVHERIRRLKVLVLRWVTTSLVLTYAVFWTWEVAGALRGPWRPPGVFGLPSDVLLVPIFAGVALVVRALLALEQRRVLRPVTPPSRPGAEPH